MIINARLYELHNDKYTNLFELDDTMGISLSQIYQVHEGKRGINQKFLVGAIKASLQH